MPIGRLRRVMRIRGERLCVAGWLALCVALALPALRVVDWECARPWISGWDCLQISVTSAWEGLRGRDSCGWYVNGIAAANLLLIASPLWIRLALPSARRLRCGATALIASAFYTLRLIVDWRLRGLYPGYYAWEASFVLTALGALHLALGRPGARRRGEAFSRVGSI